jgi:hypothetical protein
VLNVLTWHVHGSYLQSLVQVPVRWLLPVAPDRHGYGGRSPGFTWPDNVVEVPLADLADCALDVVVTQHLDHYRGDRNEVLTPAQRDLPAIHVEHDPPRGSPTDSVHPVDDGRTIVVHVTHYNRLMWDTTNPTVVIEHGIPLPAHCGSLSTPRGIVVVNHLARRGRRLGSDIFATARELLPLDLIGMGAEELGGRGEIAPADVTAIVSDYRFTFSPIRHTSLGLGILEAMAAGVPVVGMATSELATVIANGVHGFVHTDLDEVIAGGQALLDDHDLALELGANARRVVATRFAIQRFVGDWCAVLERATTTS